TALEEVLQTALEKNPDDRYQSVQEMLEALDEVIVPLGGVPSVMLGAEAQRPGDMRCPYRGLQIFEEEHAEFYFGREALVRQLVEAIDAIVASKASAVEAARIGRFLVVLGASGSGKSSLVHAGLIPALRRGDVTGSETWTICKMRPGRQPLEELATQLSRVLPNESDAAKDGNLLQRVRQLLDNLAADGRALHLAVRLAQPEQRLFLFIDQFEELFTLGSDEAERRQFIENLLFAASVHGGPVVVVLAMRADFYHHCANYRELAYRCAANQLLVGAMNRSELQRAIEQPAHQVGLKFEPGLVDAILDDVAQEPGGLPLMQHALLELWERRQGRLMTLRAYEASGGVQSAIARRADAVFDLFTPEEQAIVRRIMLRLTELGEEGAQATRRRASPSEFVIHPEDTPMVEAVLQTLAEARLITIDENTVEVAHEALIRGWPLLQWWLEEDQEGLRRHRHLTNSAQAWEALNRDPGELYRGARLATASEWAAGHAEELNLLEREFLEASQELARRLEEEREAQRQRELVQAQELAAAERHRAEVQAKARRRLTILAGVLMVLLLLATAATLFAFSQQRILNARRLAFAAQSQLDAAPETAILLAYEAIVRHHDFQTEQALRDALETFTWQPIHLTGHEDRVVSAEFSPDGQYLLTASDDGSARLWNHGGEVLNIFGGHEDSLVQASFSPDGRFILTASNDGTARLWEVRLSTTPATITEATAVFAGHEDSLTSALFSEDGTRILTASADGIARLWNLSGESLVTFEGHEDELHAAIFSPDGQQVLTASADQTARLWDVNGRLLVTFEGHEDEVEMAIFSPDGQHVLTGSPDGTARLWDIDGRPLATFSHSEQVSSIAFSPDGRQVLTAGGRENTAQLWDLSGQLLVTFYGHERPVLDTVFSRDGQLILTASDDGTARIWSLDGQTLDTFTGHSGSVPGARFSPDERHILTASGDGTARLWSEVGPPLPTLRGHTDEVEMTVYSATGEYLLTASTDATARLWDSNGQTLTVFEGHEEQVDVAVFSPDEQLILTTSEEGTARLWDRSGKLLVTMSHEDEVGDAAFSPDGKQVLTACDDGLARLWDLEGNLLVVFEGHEDQLESVAFSPDGEKVLTGSEDGTARLWDVNGQPLATYAGHTDQLTDAIFSSDGQKVLTSSRDGTARLWDLDGQAIATLVGHEDRIERALFSPDGQHVLTASWDRTARLWDLEGNVKAVFQGHTNVLKWAEFSPNGEVITTTSDDGTVRLWNLDGEPQAILQGHEDWVARVVFSPDGRRVATASRDFTARQYVVDVNELLGLAACRVGRPLTVEEIERFQVGTTRFDFERRQCPAVFSWQR
ncbi:MAG TPA: hypothetical protein VF177_08585, partial [Anaerolineae bacterium]